MGRDARKSLVFVNNKGADQPAHLRRLISAFVFRFLKSIICKLNTGEISIFLLVSVAEEKGFKLALTETPKTDFLASRPINNLQYGKGVWSMYSLPSLIRVFCFIQFWSRQILSQSL